MKSISDYLQLQTPQIVCAKFKISLRGSPKSWASNLSNIGFSSIDISKSSLSLKKIFSKDLSSNPTDFISLTLQKNLITINYTLSKKQNSTSRKIEATQIALLTLGTLGCVKLDSDFCTHISSILDSCSNSISTTQASLEFENSQLRSKLSQMQATTNSLENQCEKDARIISELEAKLSSMNRDIEKLNSLSNNSIDDLVLEWLSLHNGQIRIGEFCLQFSISPIRVEQSLERLCKLSLIKKV
jgi:hypothetical protein